MNKKKTFWASTSRRHMKDAALTTLTAQVAQTTQAAPATLGQVTDNPAAAPVTGTVVNNLPAARTYYSSDGSEIVDDQGNRWGEFINQVPVGDSSTLTAIQINTVLFRVDDNNFTTPSIPQHMIEVWFDGLEAEPSTHYNFFAPNTITTVAALASEVIVTALYLNRDES